MGASQSQIDPTHVRIYKNLLQIQSLAKRQELLETLMAGNEYIISAKRAGIYSDLLTYLGYLRSGRQPTSLLPGEVAAAAAAVTAATMNVTARNQIIMHQSKKAALDPVKVVGKQKNSEKALSFFTTCLRVLELQEEVALTEDSLKKAYKKKSIKAHPDKGGSEEEFESITRAYAYLSEIIKLVKGQRTREGEQAALPSIDSVKDQRKDASSSFQHVEPVRLDPKNLNMEAFNRMFEKTRIPDPDDDGYGDWLKDEASEKNSSAPTEKFGGKFNRNVFNQMFEEDARRRNAGSASQLAVISPQQLVMAPGLGLEIGREKADNYTAPANAELNYTDLRYAYTKGSTFSGEVSGVQVAARTIESYKAARENVGLSDEEHSAIAQQEAMMARQEQNRQFRAANEHVVANDYFERMKRLVIRDQ